MINWKGEEDQFDEHMQLAGFSQQDPHILVIFQILCMMSSHSLDRMAFIEIKRPKYLKEFHEATKGKSRRTENAPKIWYGKFHPYIWFLDVFTLAQGTTMYESRIPLNILAMILESPPWSKVLSMNCEWFWEWTFWVIWRPTNLPISLSCSNLLLKLSSITI